MAEIRIDLSSVSPVVPPREVELQLQHALKASKTLLDRTGPGNEFLGWLDLPSGTDPSLIGRMEAAAGHVAGISEVFVVTGIGGSYLGARAVIEALQHSFGLSSGKRNSPRIVYAGHQLSSVYTAELLDLLDQQDYAMAIISKSGTTTEPAVAFRLLKSHLEKKYGVNSARERIIAITDKSRGALKKLASAEGYECYVIPDDVGGRYSVLTPVGLLPVAVAGFDIRALLEGAKEMEQYLKSVKDPSANPALLYAGARNACLHNGYGIELLVNYEPALAYLAEWWKQLFGESEGKQGKGIFPASLSFTSDLHSMGQYVQEGPRKLFETVLSIENPARELMVPPIAGNADGLDFIEGASFHDINRQAEAGTRLAHTDGGVPNIRISIPQLNEFYLGQLLYFFEFSCAVSGYMLGVNPFDQPGVEAYKNNMFALLGKPGFEKQQEALKKRLEP